MNKMTDAEYVALLRRMAESLTGERCRIAELSIRMYEKTGYGLLDDREDN